MNTWYSPVFKGTSFDDNSGAVMSKSLYKVLLGIANKTLNKKEQTLINPFLQNYYSLVDNDDLVEYSPESLFATAYTHFKTLLKYDGERSQIHAYTPTLEEHGYDGDYSVIDIVTRDKPFLIDSIQMAFVRQHLSIHFVTHPIYSYQLKNKKVSALDIAAESSANNVSVIHIEFDRLPKEKLGSVKAEIKRVLDQIEQVTGDWQAMLKAATKIIQEIQNSRALPQTVEEVMETIRFLEWLQNKHFTFLGYREYEVRNGDLYGVANSGLGVLRDNGQSEISKSFAKLPEHLRAESLRPSTLLFFSKSNNLSIVHRPAYMDFISIKRFNDKGQVVGEHRILGLMTAAAYRLMPQEIPLLSHKIEEITTGAKLPSNSSKVMLNRFGQWRWMSFTSMNVMSCVSLQEPIPLKPMLPVIFTFLKTVTIIKFASVLMIT